MIPITQPTEVWHYGCRNGQAGHYACSQSGERRGTIADFMQSLDGDLHHEGSDRWLTHWFEAVDGSQMTFVARRDRTTDTRPGSWCGFLMPGNSPLATALRIAAEAFPDLAHLCRGMTCARTTQPPPGMGGQ